MIATVIPEFTMNRESRFLGRYEQTDLSKNINKFWECLYLEPDRCLVRWGRIGSKNPQKGIFDAYTAEDRAQKKLREGYHYVNGSEKSMEAIHQAALEEAIPQANTVKPGRGRM